MRFEGRISGWKDDKGYGFVEPNGGGERAFVHIKAFQSGARRPVDGDRISYLVSTDSRGRKNAATVCFAGREVEARRTARRTPRLAIGFSFLLGALLGTFLGIVPAAITIGYGMLSALSFTVYSLDKSAAAKGRQRTPENTLHLLDLLGGWPGALIAQQRSRHKTAKVSFQLVFWCTAVANVAAVVWLVQSDKANALGGLLSGG